MLAASICTRGGKAVLSRQFREMQRSRIEALLASFPKLADSGTQHTTVEQDNVRFVYQPLDELYMVLITNKQSNILQDIDSLHLFAQVVTSTCKTLDERDILKNAYELLSAFDELVTLGYRENLTISQIKTFLEMESHEERIQEIISRVGFLQTIPIRNLANWNLRTKSSKQQRSASAKQNNWRCSVRRFQGVVEVPYQVGHSTQHIHHLHNLPIPKPMIHTKQQRASLSSRLIRCLCKTTEVNVLQK